MTASGETSFERQSPAFLFLYALAVAGGAIAYVPFLTILLPAHVTAFAGEDSLSVLAYIAFAGAVSASIANIAFGWLSDLTGTRRPWIACGLVLASGLLLTVREIRDPAALIVIIVGWQFALNMMLAPLAAWAGDCVPDAQKGLLGGLMALAPALGALSGFVVTTEFWVPTGYRLEYVVGLTLLCVLPVLLFGRPKPIVAPQPTEAADNPPLSLKSMVSRMWLARLLVQVAEASLFAFLLLWFRSIDPDFADNRAAAIFSAVLGGAVLLALWLGRWSDRHEKPIQPLVLCAAASALGLAIMAASSGLVPAVVGYVIFGLGGSIFLALHSSQTLRVLPDPARRGRDLGIFNLTNTVPSLIMPWLTLALVPVYGFSELFVLLALLALLSALLLAGKRDPTN
jgi:MFS family permease